ncbi:Hypothetical predicted protein [Lecanosticta acicola]|uniref:Uncharacterized protein n=1 Tax=Lecanosticta acicola TaxID=111012 RepID=A0AAI9EEK0_9PEZI|nr:Hypothetical predicted protein [Lecanosticta acicola]
MTTPNTPVPPAKKPATNATNAIPSAAEDPMHSHSVEALLGEKEKEKEKDMSNAELQDRISQLGVGEEDISDELEDEGSGGDQQLGHAYSGSDECPEGLAAGEESGSGNDAALERSRNEKSAKAVKKHVWNLWPNFQLPEFISHLVILALLTTNILSGVLYLSSDRHGGSSSNPTTAAPPSCDCTTGNVGNVPDLLTTTSQGWPIRTFSSHPEAALTSLRYLLTLMPTTHMTPDRHQSLDQLLVEAEQAVPISTSEEEEDEMLSSSSSSPSQEEESGKIYTLPPALLLHPTAGVGVGVGVGVGGACHVADEELCRVRDLYLPRGLAGVDWECEAAEMWVDEWNSIVRGCVKGLIGRVRGRARASHGEVGR